MKLLGCATSNAWALPRTLAPLQPCRCGTVSGRPRERCMATLPTQGTCPCKRMRARARQPSWNSGGSRGNRGTKGTRGTRGSRGPGTLGATARVALRYSQGRRAHGRHVGSRSAVPPQKDNCGCGARDMVTVLVHTPIDAFLQLRVRNKHLGHHGQLTRSSCRWGSAPPGARTHTLTHAYATAARTNAHKDARACFKCLTSPGQVWVENATLAVGICMQRAQQVHRGQRQTRCAHEGRRAQQRTGWGAPANVSPLAAFVGTQVGTPAQTSRAHAHGAMARHG
jgi:hypothetical protein